MLALIAAAALATPSPAPSPTPDPCGGETRLLATLNRPTIGYSACAVAPRTVVFEEGYQLERQGSGQTLTQYPQSFIRIGVAQRLELDAIGPSYNRVAGNGSSTAGFQDSGIGFKYELAPKGDCTIGFDGLYTSPNGSSAFTNGGYTAAANGDLACSLTSSFGIATTQEFGTVSGARADGTFGRYLLWTPSIVATEQFAGGNQLYFEYVYQSKIAPDAGGRAFLDYGIQHLIGSHVEVDAEMGHALTGNAAQTFNYVGVGFGVQLDEK